MKWLFVVYKHFSQSVFCTFFLDIQMSCEVGNAHISIFLLLVQLNRYTVLQFDTHCGGKG